MPDDLVSRLEELGWSLEVDRERGELYLTHIQTERRYVFDESGNFTVPGDGDIGGEIAELHELLSTALEGEAEPPEICSIDCAEPVTIASEQRISLDAPTIELSAGSATRLELSLEGLELAAPYVDMSSVSDFDAEAGGVMSLDGALLRLN